MAPEENLFIYLSIYIHILMYVYIFTHESRRVAFSRAAGLLLLPGSAPPSLTDLILFLSYHISRNFLKANEADFILWEFSVMCFFSPHRKLKAIKSVSPF